MKRALRFSYVTLLIGVGQLGCTGALTSSTRAPQDGGVEVNAARIDAPSASVGSTAGRLEVAEYVAFMASVARADDEAWQAVFNDVTAARLAAPTARNRLRLALSLSAPKRPASDLRVARNILHELLGDPEQMEPAVRNLIEVQLIETERRLTLMDQLESARKQLTGLREEYEHVARQGAKDQDELERVSAALAEAKAKIRALTSIEQSLEEDEEKKLVP